MKVVKTPAMMGTRHPIVDIEISNNLDPHWDYSLAKPCLVGFFVDEELTQFLLMSHNEKKTKDFVKKIQDFLSTIDGRPHAFNTKMETGCFKVLLGYSPKLHEIKPFNGKGVSKEYLFSYLVKKGAVSNFPFRDPLNGHSELCPELWRKGHFEEVRQHNVCCLTKESKILEHRELLLNDFQHLLKEDGWIQEGVELP